MYFWPRFFSSHISQKAISWKEGKFTVAWVQLRRPQGLELMKRFISLCNVYSLLVTSTFFLGHITIFRSFSISVARLLSISRVFYTYTTELYIYLSLKSLVCSVNRLQVRVARKGSRFWENASKVTAFDKHILIQSTYIYYSYYQPKQWSLSCRFYYIGSWEWKRCVNNDV